MKHLFLAALMLLPICSFGQIESLVINEVQVANVDSYVDPSFNYGGWIELYNPTNSAIDISRMYLSEDSTNLKQFRMPTSTPTVPANGYKVLWFDHNVADGNYGGDAAHQIRFKLDMDGGVLYLSNSDGVLFKTFNYPKGISRCSYSRKTDGGTEWGYTATPTPGKSNNGNTFASVRLDAPVVDTGSCLFTGTLSFHVTIPESATLYYTTDGTCPTKTNGKTSPNGSFATTTTTTYRFRLFADGKLPSEVVTRSFIKRDKTYTLPVISVVTDPDNLYDDSIGVYTDGVNGISGRGISYKSNRNMDWERPVNFEYITADNKMVANQEATFYISGGWSRHWLPSSFKIKAEKIYEGVNSIDYQFFDSKPFNKHKVLLFRNGGNDTWGRMKDACIQEVIRRSGMYVDGQAWRPVHVFMNGSYLAMLNLREPNNKFFAYSNYGIDTDNVDALEMGAESSQFVLKAGDRTAYSKMYSYATSGTSQNYEALCGLLDIDEYINYMAVECYLGSSDWLMNNNNLKIFRSRDDDGKFHHVLFDLDAAFDYTNMLTQFKNSPSKNNSTYMFSKLATVSSFKRRFIDAYCIVNGSVFEPNRVKAICTEMGNATNDAISLDGHSSWSSCNGVASSASDTSKRNARMSSLKSYFGITTTDLQISTNISEAQLKINDEIVPTSAFKGPIMMPVTLKATAPAGYNFVGWYTSSSGTSTLFSKGTTWKYYDQGSLDGKDWTTSPTGFSSGSAPLGYSKDGLKTTISYGSNSNDKYPTYYFTRAFNLSAEPSNTDVFTLDYTVDDGFIVYVNGTEAARYNMPSGTVSYSTYATTYCSGNPDEGSTTLDASLFKKGENIIAVEVHNNSGTSSDIYWDAALTRTYDNIGSEGLVSPEREYTLSTTTATQLKAVFEPVPDEYLIPAGSTPVVVNEVSAGNSIYVNEYFKKNDWIELYNTTSEDIDLAGMYISDNPDDLQKYQISAAETDGSTIIPAHGYKIIWADKLSPISQLHASFKLANADEESAIISAGDLSWSNRLTYSAHAGNETVGRYPDGGKCVYHMTLPTIGARNILTSYAQWLSGEDKNFDVEEYLAGIDSPEVSSETSNEAGQTSAGDTYYSIDGMQLDGPRRGINIIRHQNTDGTVSTRRILVK